MSRERLDAVLARRNLRRSNPPVAISQPQQKVPPIQLPVQPTSEQRNRRPATNQSTHQQTFAAPPPVQFIPTSVQQPASSRSTTSVASVASVQSSASSMRPQSAQPTRPASKRQPKQVEHDDDDAQSVLSSTSSLTADMLASLEEPQHEEDDFDALYNDEPEDEPIKFKPTAVKQVAIKSKAPAKRAPSKQPVEEEPMTSEDDHHQEQEEEEQHEDDEEAEELETKRKRGRPAGSYKQRYQPSVATGVDGNNYLQLIPKQSLAKLVKSITTQSMGSDIIDTCREVLDLVINSAIQGQNVLNVNLVANLIQTDFKDGDSELSSDVTINPTVFDRFVRAICDKSQVQVKRDAVYLFQLYCETYLLKMVKAADLVAGSARRARIQGSDLTIAYHIFNM